MKSSGALVLDNDEKRVHSTVVLYYEAQKGQKKKNNNSNL